MSVKPIANPFYIFLLTIANLLHYWRQLIRPNLGYIVGYCVIHTLIAKPIINRLVEYEVNSINGFFYQSFLGTRWTMSKLAVRLLRWTQAKWLTSVLARELRRKWRRSFKTIVAEADGLPLQALAYKKPPKNSEESSPVKWVKYYIFLGWFSTVSSPLLMHFLLMILSVPIHAIPVFGAWIYMYVHGGIKARRICAEYSRTQGSWTRLDRSRFCAKAARAMRPYACLLEILEDTPVGCLIMPVLDLSVVSWMSHMKVLDQVDNLTVQKIESRPSMQHINLKHQ
eukprot:Blabericola_migrator_1__9736@NODE_532_length_7786_cov_102_495531_g405_i0_p4_GENE_NODE_532_length_7786_cov_102_495531_g405_i0NODE_532_length_7786_cov_102_495531_g405_i0_p4_ORF_typecomplete_len283_score38_34EI24/PF07264_11/1_4e05_NODE_532_length_7786_cov_102_495531_g405_i014822330